MAIDVELCVSLFFPLLSVLLSFYLISSLSRSLSHSLFCFYSTLLLPFPFFPSIRCCSLVFVYKKGKKKRKKRVSMIHFIIIIHFIYYTVSPENICSFCNNTYPPPELRYSSLLTFVSGNSFFFLFLSFSIFFICFHFLLPFSVIFICFFSPSFLSFFFRLLPYFFLLLLYHFRNVSSPSPFSPPLSLFSQFFASSYLPFLFDSFPSYCYRPYHPSPFLLFISSFLFLLFLHTISGYYQMEEVKEKGEE